jgi:phosphoribosylformimino-5-aminoimidazole carboxamide ribotide isomerase
MKFRPCIDIHDGKVKQIVGSTLSDSTQGLQTNFETNLSAAHYAEIYKKDNITGGHVIMLGKGNESAATAALQAFEGGLQIGGGINSQNAKRFLDAGASHVIVTSYVFHDGAIDWARLGELEKVVGKAHLVIDLSCKKRDGEYFVVTDRWQNFTTTTLSPDLFQKLEMHCDEFLIHAADVEGKQGGIDSELVQNLAGSSSRPVTYAGGVRSIDDLEMIRVLGNSSVDATIGSALDLFGGPLRYADVIEWFSLNHKKGTEDKIF